MDSGALNYRAFLDGDEKAFEELIVLYSNHLVYFINGYVHDLAASEDLMEDTFLDLYVHRRRYEDRGATFKTYLFKIARNKATSYLRAGKRFSTEPLEKAYDVADQSDVEEAVLNSERKERLSGAMREMKAEYREVLILAYIEDLSAEEIGRIIRKSKKQTENLIYRAKLQLKNILGEEDF